MRGRLEQLAVNLDEATKPAWKDGDPVPAGYKVVFGKLLRVDAAGKPLAKPKVADWWKPRKPLSGTPWWWKTGKKEDLDEAFSRLGAVPIIDLIHFARQVAILPRGAFDTLVQLMMWYDLDNADPKRRPADLDGTQLREIERIMGKTHPDIPKAVAAYLAAGKS